MQSHLLKLWMEMKKTYAGVWGKYVEKFTLHDRNTGNLYELSCYQCSTNR